MELPSAPGLVEVERESLARDLNEIVAVAPIVAVFCCALRARRAMELPGINCDGFCNAFRHAAIATLVCVAIAEI